MKKKYLFLAATALTTACGAMLAQNPQSAGIVYQQAGVLSLQSGAGGPIMVGLPGMMGSEIFDLAGSPLSATHQSHSLQVLSDGTRIERNESQQIYRDSMGRTRIESEPFGSGTVLIQDPVSGAATALDPTTKTAQKMGRGPSTAMAVAQMEKARLSATITVRAGGVMAQAVAPGVAASSAAKPVTEDFPPRNVNGVMATGRRTTLTIPAGEIGNDRPIQVVNETWYSSDLQMMVKSSNSDPRFGETSFELTNISRNEPDPSLFQVPADYVVSEPKPVQYRTVQPKE